MSSAWNYYDVEIGPLGASLLVAPDESESGVAMVEHTLPPGALGAPMHRHEHEDELSFVLRGELTVREGATVSTVGAGDAAAKERGVWHTFWNGGEEPVRFLEVIAPGGFAGYFEEVAAAFDERPPDETAMTRVAEIAADYDLEMDPDSVPELVEEYGLSM